MQQAQFEGEEQLDNFAKKIEGVTEVALSVLGDTRTTKVSEHSFVAQPIVRIRCEADVRDENSRDPLATKTLVWEVVKEPRTGREEDDAVERVKRALRARGFVVTVPARAM
jgi:hypothetical protein